jgi:DNA-binding CsgD family transcriptional regulator
VFDLRKLEDVGNRLGEAVLDPLRWPVLMESICEAVGATGAAMLQSDVRTEGIPLTASVAEYFQQSYFKNKLHVSDVRAARGVPLLLTGKEVVTDADLFRSESEMLRDPLYASLGEYGLKWFAVVGFRAGSALWGLSIQRTPREGMFDPHESEILSRLSLSLTEAATLSTAVGWATLSGVTNALGLIGRPALAVSRFGFILEMNAAAGQVFDDEIGIRNRRLFVRDGRAQSMLDALVAQIMAPRRTRTPAQPIIARRRTKRPVVIHALPVEGVASSPFLGAGLILILTDLDAKSSLQREVLAQAFGLTPSESRLGVLIGTGISIEEAADRLGLSRETVRNELKAIFGKTETHRQGELVALLAKL